jgi:hypothetical protein
MDKYESRANSIMNHIQLIISKRASYVYSKAFAQNMKLYDYYKNKSKSM